MDNPAEEINGIILNLTTGSPKTQEQTVKQYFTHDVSFTHPFCQVQGNRRTYLRVLQWYKIMSPHVDLRVNSVAYDEKNLIIYANISQIFSIAVVPFHSSPVTLTAVLHLEYGQELNIASPTTSTTTPARYYIKSQNDLYQVDQFVRFFLQPWWLGSMVIHLWWWFATVLCVLAAYVGAPVTRWNQARADADQGGASTNTTPGLTFRRFEGKDQRHKAGLVESPKANLR